jgi:hypothetical protein
MSQPVRYRNVEVLVHLAAEQEAAYEQRYNLAPRMLAVTMQCNTASSRIVKVGCMCHYLGDKQAIRSLKLSHAI